MHSNTDQIKMTLHKV